METIFKKIHEGLDLFNYYYSRHEASNNDSQRDKLESDLKKEIKKLQKFRDQIKNWQGNDSLEATIALQKLQEHRRLVEEAMECYKEVEKNSKMKSFSNQSIMLASLDQSGRELSQEAMEAHDFLSGIVDELNEQNEGLDEEYEKLSLKKARKSALTAVEERKQEIETFKLRNEMHIEEIENIMGYLKTRKVSVDLVLAIQEDLKFYVELNQEPDFVDDETLYDDLKREARENHENNAVAARIDEPMDASANEDSNVLINGDENTSPDPSLQDHNSQSQEKPAVKLKSPIPHGIEATSSTQAASVPSLTSMHSSPNGKLIVKTDSLESNPGFITNLKPAATPTKPLKWSLAAARASQTHDESNGSSFATAPVAKSQDSTNNNGPPTSSPAGTSKQEEQVKNSETVASSELLSLLTKNDKDFAYLQVLKNSKLLPSEMDLFSDTSLLKLPAGIKEFVLGYVASNQTPGTPKLLRTSQMYSPYSSFISRPQCASTRQSMWKPLALLSKLSNYWQALCASNKFEEYVNDLQMYNDNASVEVLNALNELTMVLFYGLYYGLLPMENIIAESYLFKLGWRPYNHMLGLVESAEPERAQARTLFWLKKMSSTTGPRIGVQLETGDFRAFDALTWEIHVKTNFRFDRGLSQPIPGRSLF